LLLAFFCVAHAVLFVITENKPSVRLTVDSRDYLTAGRNLLSRGVLYSGDLNAPIDPANYTRRSPGYPFVVGLLGTMGDPLRLTILWQIALNLLGALLLWWLAGHFGLEPGYRLLLAGLFLAYPAQIIYTHTVMTEVMFELLLLSSVALLAVYLKSRNDIFLLLMNLALGIAALTRPVLAYFWVPNLVYHGWLALRFRRWRPVLCALIPVLIVTGWCYRNYERTNYFHFSSITYSTLKLRMVWRPGFRAKWETRETAGQDLATGTEALEKAYIEDRVKNWPRTIWVYCLGSGSFFTDPGRFDVYQILGLPQDIHIRFVAGGPPLLKVLRRIPPPILVFLAVMAVVNVFIFCSFVFMMFKARLPAEFKAFAGLIVLYMVVITGSIGASRYRLPVEPILLLGVPFFVKWLRERRELRSE